MTPIRYLPTPNTMDMLPPHAGLAGLRAARRGGFANLRGETGPEGGIRLLPTPTASLGDGRGPQPPARRKAGNHAVNLKDTVEKGPIRYPPTPTAEGIGIGGRRTDDTDDETGKDGETALANGRYEGSDTGCMPTPRASDPKGHNQRRNQDCLEGATAFGTSATFLPTPTTFDTASERMRSTTWRPGGTRALCLPRAIRAIMTGERPDGATPPAAGPRRTVDWGRFAPAVHRWENIIGRPAPCPTCATGALRRWLTERAEPQWLDPSWLKAHAPRPDGQCRLDQPMRERVMALWRDTSDGTDLIAPFWRAIGSLDPDEPIASTMLPARCVTDYWDDMRQAQWRRNPDAHGAYRPLTLAHLSPKLSEWMMGLPDGWITDPAVWRGVDGNHRNMMLKLAGNGVVPQQAAAAIRWALDVRDRLER